MGWPMPTEPFENFRSPGPRQAKSTPFVPIRIIVVALYLFYVATIGRTLTWFDSEITAQPKLPWVLGLELAFLALFSLLLWRPGISRLLLNIYFSIQSILITLVVVLEPYLDFVPILFVMLSCQAALYFNGRNRWVWIVIFVFLIPGPLMLIQNPLRSLALELSNMAATIVLAAYITAGQEEEAIRAHHQAILAELQESHRQLQLYTGQVEELAAIEERNRLARELHDSVSQTMFSIILNVRATQLLLQRDPARLRAQLVTLQGLAQSALAEMRGLIAQLRPKAE
jgi:signal transduction histidine kinase